MGQGGRAAGPTITDAPTISLAELDLPRLTARALQLDMMAILRECNAVSSFSPACINLQATSHILASTCKATSLHLVSHAVREVRAWTFCILAMFDCHLV